MATQGLATVVVAVKLAGSMSWSKSDYSSGARSALRLLHSPARPSEQVMRALAHVMLRALAHVMRGKVTMPGQLMSDGGLGDGDGLFARFSAVAQRAGVYTASDYGDLVEHFVRRWRVPDLEAGLSGEGRRAQEYVCGLARKIRRMEELAHRRAAREGPVLARFSCIFDRTLVVG